MIHAGYIFTRPHMNVVWFDEHILHGLDHELIDLYRYYSAAIKEHSEGNVDLIPLNQNELELRAIYSTEAQYEAMQALMKEDPKLIAFIEHITNYCATHGINGREFKEVI